jgi:hypothetical protein
MLLHLALGSLVVSTAAARVITSETEFRDAVVSPTTVSFNQFGVGFLPQTTLQMGAVTVRLTNAGSAPIFGPGSFGFTTNFLSTGVQDGGNNVEITFPAGTKALGMKIASVFPVTVTASYASASEMVTFSASQVSFLGFAESPGLQGFQRITISSPFDPLRIPIVNVGDITYASGLANSEISVPTLSGTGLAILAVILLVVGWKCSAARNRLPQPTSRS